MTPLEFFRENERKKKNNHPGKLATSLISTSQLSVIDYAIELPLLPPAELCDICDGAIRWESVYRDRTWRCAECEPWPNRSLVGRIINLGSFTAEQGGPAWLDYATGERIDLDALAAASAASAAAARRSKGEDPDAWSDKLELIQRIDRDGVIHRRWSLPGLKMITFEIGIGEDGRMIPFATGGNGIVGTKFPPKVREIPSEEILARTRNGK